MPLNLKELKERIYNEEKVVKILEELGCDCIDTEQHGTLLTARPPNSKNKRAVQVRLTPTLPSYIRNRGISGDIFSVVGYFLYDCTDFEQVKSNLRHIVQWILNILEYDDFEFVFSDEDAPKPKTDWNWWLRPIQKQRIKEIEFVENEIKHESILNQYIWYPWFGWIEAGLDWETQMIFNIGFDVQSERVIFPIHNKDGHLIGIKGRYVGKNKEIEEEYKYIYLVPCNKSLELFNIHRALPHIKEKREVIIVEGAKTVMYLWQWGFKNSVSIEGDHLSPVQVKLLRDLGIDVELVFAWDKDKDKKFIVDQIKQIKNRNKFVIYDKNGILTDEKASPVDEGKEKWLELYNNHKYKII